MAAAAVAAVPGLLPVSCGAQGIRQPASLWPCCCHSLCGGASKRGWKRGWKQEGTTGELRTVAAFSDRQTEKGHVFRLISVSTEFRVHDIDESCLFGFAYFVFVLFFVDERTNERNLVLVTATAVSPIHFLVVVVLLLFALLAVFFFFALLSFFL